MDSNKLNDFIVVGEFSEVEGPISRLLITVDDADKIILDDGEPFNLEAFVLRVMSVELNTNNDDWCSIIELNDNPSATQRLSAFVQHINLLDLNARGYVRSIIIAFITEEGDKLMNNFPLFHQRMSKVSETLKAVNHKIFSRDLQMRLADLLLTELESKNAGGFNDFAYSHTAQSLRENIDDLCHLHSRIPSHSDVKICFPPNHKLNNRDQGILATIHKDNIDVTDLNIYTPKIILSLQQNSSIYSKKLRSVTDLCGDNWEIAMEILRVMINELNKPDFVLYFEFEEIDYSHFETNLVIGSSSYLNFNFSSNNLPQGATYGDLIPQDTTVNNSQPQTKTDVINISLERTELKNPLILEMAMSNQSGVRQELLDANSASNSKQPSDSEPSLHANAQSLKRRSNPAQRVTDSAETSLLDLHHNPNPNHDSSHAKKRASYDPRVQQAATKQVLTASGSTATELSSLTSSANIMFAIDDVNPEAETSVEDANPKRRSKNHTNNNSNLTDSEKKLLQSSHEDIKSGEDSISESESKRPTTPKHTSNNNSNDTAGQNHHRSDLSTSSAKIGEDIESAVANENENNGDTANESAALTAGAQTSGAISEEANSTATRDDASGSSSVAVVVTSSDTTSPSVPANHAALSKAIAVDSHNIHYPPVYNYYATSPSNYSNVGSLSRFTETSKELTPSREGFTSSTKISPAASRDQASQVSQETQRDVEPRKIDKSSFRYFLHSSMHNIFGSILDPNAYLGGECGYGLLKYVRQNHVWMSPLIYSLMKGRTVIIKGYPEDVVPLIQALSIFVVSSLTSSTRNIVEWFDEPLTFSVLSSFKLIGVLRDRVIPLVLQKYTTILDLDKNQLQAPAYKDGNYIGEILKKEIVLASASDDATFIAYIHSVLYEIAMKSCQCYHQCWIGTVNPLDTQREQNDLKRSHSKLKKSKSLENIDLGEKTRQLVKNIDFEKSRLENNSSTWTSFSMDEFKKNGAQKEELSRQKQKVLRKYFFEKNQIAESDREIIMYFCKIIITQQNELEQQQRLLSPSSTGQSNTNGTANSSFNVPQTIYLDYSPTQIFSDEQLK